MSAAVAVCPSCGAPAGGRFCGHCGADLSVAGNWQDCIYLGRGAALYRRAPREIFAVLPLLFEPFKHLDAIAWPQWRSILLIALMGIAPLGFVTFFSALGDWYDAYKVLGLYFSALWAVVFAAAFRATGIRWRIGLAAYFGTTFIGMTVLSLSLALGIEHTRAALVEAHSLLVAIPSAIVFIGFPEELAKALVLFAIWRFAGIPPLRAFLFYGLLSGLGFGIKEGVQYESTVYLKAAGDNAIAYYLHSVLRMTSLPFFHAMWTGTAAYLIWFAARVPSARAGLIVLAVLVPATFHGLYDAFAGHGGLWSFAALVVAGTSISLLGIYLASASRFERWLSLPVDDDDETAAVTTAAANPANEPA
ncbi:MAG TPA: PrsW family glutamic-type intramembrane protease [Candidatus Elarobacter sp.]|jgi:RsiW-degrading membrane proteinase PrsW (M82 family)|nr:PrsW family glutamic-type intramembrane protease [Candidatus Elarobacter sp.]